MKILYVYSNCSEKKYKILFSDSKTMILQQAQKYHSLLINGLAENGADVCCISGLPINRALTKQIYIRAEKEWIDGVQYRYFATINIGFVRRIQLMIKSFFSTLMADKDTVVISDILNASVAMGALAGAKIRRFPTVGIVTDVPGCLASHEKPGVLERIDAYLMKKYSAYILLTDAMNEIVNVKKKPYVVMEGHVDCSMGTVDNRLAEKNGPKVLLYAGSLKKIYGIDRIVSAFLKIDLPGWEFHIYGDGDYREELKKLCDKHPNVQYRGVKLNREIVDAEIKATLLVNPRPTDEEYTKYSFPSKNMEYMVSGTPVLTTKLPGMPKEYEPYVYLFTDESVDGMEQTLLQVLRLSPEVLHDMGSKAKKFVLENKSNVAQAKRILKLVSVLEKH